MNNVRLFHKLFLYLENVNLFEINLFETSMSYRQMQYEQSFIDFFYIHNVNLCIFYEFCNNLWFKNFKLS